MRTHRAIGAVGVPFGQQRRAAVAVAAAAADAATDVSGYLTGREREKRDDHEVTAQSKHTHGGPRGTRDKILSTIAPPSHSPLGPGPLDREIKPLNTDRYSTGSRSASIICR